MMLRNDQRGGLIIEVLLSVVFVMIFSAALMALNRANAQVTTSAQRTSQAVSLARETMEQVYAMKREAWSFVDVPAGEYEVVRQGEQYVFAPSDGDVIDGTFTRTLRVELGIREPNGERRLGSGLPDANTRLVTVTIAWIDRDQPQSLTLSGYLTNWQEATP